MFDTFEQLWASLGTMVVLTGGCAIACVILIKFLSSRAGIRMRAAGSSPIFAESIGLRPGIRLVLGLSFTNALAALSGILISDYQGFADVGSGQGVLILALAALSIGEALIPQRRLAYYTFVVSSAISGSIIYHVVVSAAVRAGLAPTDLRLATGVLVLFVVVVRVTRQRGNIEASLAQ